MKKFRNVVLGVAAVLMAFGCGSKEVEIEIQNDLPPEQRQAMDEMQQRMMLQQQQMLQQIGALPQNGPQQTPQQ